MLRRNIANLPRGSTLHVAMETLLSPHGFAWQRRVVG